MPQPGKLDDKDVKNKDQKSIPVVKDQKINPGVKTGDQCGSIALGHHSCCWALTGAGTAVFL